MVLLYFVVGGISLALEARGVPASAITGVVIHSDEITYHVAPEHLVAFALALRDEAPTPR